MKNQHWADTYADKVIREKKEKLGQKILTCASGITPSGTVHIGNFREIISVELVVRALRDKGEQPRFIYSWDDFDVFRKVPANIPNKEEFEQYLRMPITDIPDPWERASSYALGNEQAIEKLLSIFGMNPEYIYQAKAYKEGKYAEGIRKALEKRQEIIDILNTHRTKPLEDNWWPISIFSEFSKKDSTEILSWDGEWTLTYRCMETKKESTVDIRSSGVVKLLWRIDWPMRWQYEQVVFEPAGKDHHSQGGSFDTAIPIANQVYDYESPVTFMYGFVSIKGGAGKISSSSGEVISVDDVLEVYQPEIIRYLFVSTRPNAEFAISFDLDVIKVYEDYDRCERIYFGLEKVGEDRKIKETRIYELSQTYEIPKTMPLQVPIRHLCNLLQIYSGDKEKVLAMLKDEFGAKVHEQKERLLVRMDCAWNWINMYAPEDFKFSLRKEDTELQETEKEKKAIAYLREHLLSSMGTLTDKEVNSHIYDAARSAEMEPQEFFTTLYRRVIGKEKGPRLGSFFNILGKDIIEKYLQ